MNPGDSIRIGAMLFESLHADEDGNVILKFKLPPAECAKAGLFPVMREIEFSGLFTPAGVRNTEPSL